MIYDCCVRQKKCRSILKHVLKRRDNRKSSRRPVVSLSHATKSYRVNRPLGSLRKRRKESGSKYFSARAKAYGPHTGIFPIVLSPGYTFKHCYITFVVGSTMLERVACMFDDVCSTFFVGEMF